MLAVSLQVSHGNMELNYKFIKKNNSCLRINTFEGVVKGYIKRKHFDRKSCIWSVIYIQNMQRNLLVTQ